MSLLPMIVTPGGARGGARAGDINMTTKASVRLGLRRGELRALRWPNVKLERDKLNVCENLVMDDGEERTCADGPDLGAAQGAVRVALRRGEHVIADDEGGHNLNDLHELIGPFRAHPVQLRFVASSATRPSARGATRTLVAGCEACGEVAIDVHSGISSARPRTRRAALSRARVSATPDPPLARS